MTVHKTHRPPSPQFAILPLNLTVCGMAVYRPGPIIKFRGRLLRTPPAGRSAFLLTEMDLLTANNSDACASLVADLLSGKFEGVSRESLVELVRRLSGDLCFRAYKKTSPRWGIDATMLLAKHEPRDFMPVLARVRDGKESALEYIYTSGLAHLAFRIAAGYPEDHTEPLHRRHADETLLLLGSSSDPAWLLRSMTTVHVSPGPLPAFDTGIARWCFDNPHHTPSTRAAALMLCSAPVVSELSYEGVLTVSDVCNWIRPRLSAVFDSQIMLALTLPPEVPGASQLRHRLLYMLRNAPAYFLALDEAQQYSVLREQYRNLDADTIAYAIALAPTWTRTLKELVLAAQRLHQASPASRRSPVPPDQSPAQ